MKSQRAFLALLSIAACSIYSGCDSDSSSSRITVTPSSATVAKGQSIEFTVSGGYEYTWSLEEDSSGSEPYGSLSTRRGATTVYTSLRDGDASAVVRVLTVTSTIEGSGNTNSSPDEWTTEAYITHSADGTSGGDDDDPLALAPSTVTLKINEFQEFKASGGTGSYTWTIDPTTHGSLSASSGSDVVYTATSATNATVIITVFSGTESRNAVITQTDS